MFEDRGAVAWLLGLAIVWGLSIPITKIGLGDTTPLTLTALRFVIAVPAFALFLRGRPRPGGRDLAVLALLGAGGIGIGQAAQTIGVNGASAAVATVISATIPIFTVMLGAWRLGQPVRPRQYAGLGLALIGIAVVAGLGADATAGTRWWGVTAMIISSVAVALYYIFSAELSARLGVMTVGAWTTIFGTASLLPLIGWEAKFGGGIGWGWQGLWVAAYLGLAVTAAGLWIWLSMLARVPVRLAASIQYLQPLIGVAASAVLFADPLGPSFMIGSALVLAGIALTATR